MSSPPFERKGFTVTVRLRLAAAVTVVVIALPPVGVAAAEDTTPPVGTVVIDGGATWRNDLSDVTLLLDATDDLAGVESVEWRANGSAWMLRPYSPYPITVQLPGIHQGVNTVEARWTDFEGNTSALASDSIKVDTVSPSLTAELWTNDASSITVDVTASDGNGIEGIYFSCDEGGDWFRMPLAARIKVPTGPTGMDCQAFGNVTVFAESRDPAGNATRTWLYPWLPPAVTFTTPKPAVTGQAFTVAPDLPDSLVVSAGGSCAYGLRWGNDRALDETLFDDTFGSLYVERPPTAGGCPAWTFTLPWVPYPQFEATFDVITDLGDGLTKVSGGKRRFDATVASTDRRITTSNLPLVQVLPSTYTLVVGKPVTYTRYLVGGHVPCCGDRWVAYQGDGDDANHWTKSGGSTFTITPFETGNILVVWDQAHGARRIQALYDPPVRRPDRTVPNTTRPTIRIAPGTGPSRRTVQVAWSGTDTGWGVGSYRLERSANGGAWTKVALPTPSATTFVQKLTVGSAYRYRVRATDKAGNTGTWDTSLVWDLRRIPLTRTANVR